MSGRALKHASAAHTMVSTNIIDIIAARTTALHKTHRTEWAVEYMSLSYICIASHDECDFFFLFRSFVILASGACAFAWPTSATGTMLSWRARPKTMMIIIIINSFFIHPGDASTAHIVHFIVRFEWCCRRAYTTIDQFASIAHHRLNFDRETLKPAGRPFFKPPTKKIIIHYLLLFTQNNYPLLCLRRITLLFSKPFYDTPSGK